MLHPILRSLIAVAMFSAVAQAALERPAIADAPSPRLTIVAPLGGRLGTSVDVQVTGTGLEGLTALQCDEPRIKATKRGESQFTIEIPADVSPGLYDLRVLGANGLSSPRRFFVSPRATFPEIESNGKEREAQAVDLEMSLCGSIGTPGEVDTYRFRARSGQRVVIEGWAERLDSKLRAVLELEDERGRRLASSRGYEGLDPLIDFVAPADGHYVVRVFDLTYTGSTEHVYRLDIDTGPRLDFAWPNVVEQGKSTRLTLFGRNLGRSGGARSDPAQLDQVVVDVTPPPPGASLLTRTFERPSRFSVEEFPVDFPGAPAPVLVGMTDVPVILEAENNHQPSTAQRILWPSEICGRLEAGDEKDWYQIHADRGDVVWLELFGERIGAPVDLDLSVLDVRTEREVLHLTDTLDDSEENSINTSHSDSSGRWVAPATGDYRIVVRNLIGGSRRAPRRLYRLSVRREEADFHLMAAPAGGQGSAGWNVPRGGRALIGLVATRSRGLSGPIRVTASGLPDGLECPDVWLGPGVTRVPLIVSSSLDASREPRAITLTGHADLGGVEVVHQARGAIVISTDPPTPSARLTDRIVVATGPESPGNMSATLGRTFVSQGTVMDVLLYLDVPPGWKPGTIAITGVGIPAEPVERIALDSADPSKMRLSLRVPERLAPGPYTFAIRADTELTKPAEKPGSKPITRAAVVYSNPLTIEVGPGAIDLRVAPNTPKTIKRGETVQIHYKALRRSGFIGKIHTELYAAEGVNGLRAMGVTFVGQTESGVIQVVASDDAPLGRQTTLRLEAVGTVEDEPIHHVGCFLDLEITR
jgi:hypothetical protein